MLSCIFKTMKGKQRGRLYWIQFVWNEIEQTWNEFDNIINGGLHLHTAILLMYKRALSLVKIHWRLTLLHHFFFHHRSHNYCLYFLWIILSAARDIETHTHTLCKMGCFSSCEWWKCVTLLLIHWVRVLFRFFCFWIMFINPKLVMNPWGIWNTYAYTAMSI